MTDLPAKKVAPAADGVVYGIAALVVALHVVGADAAVRLFPRRA